MFFLFSLCFQQYFLGVQREQYLYHISHINFSQQTFSCYDGSNEIPLSKLNDRHRDCNDGSDEMGTSEGPADIPFYCVNSPFIPKNISRSQVNDGNCDCCDGSDENSTTSPDVQCPNTCEKLNKPRYVPLNDLKGVIINGISHRRVLRNSADRLVNRSNELIEKYQNEVNDIQNQIDILKEELKSVNPPQSILQKHPFITSMWNKLFFIQNDVTFEEVFYGTEGRIKYLNGQLKKLNEKIIHEKYKYALIFDNNISLQYLPLLNVSFANGDYDFLFLKEMFKGSVSIGKFKRFDEKNRVIELDDGDFCPEINEGRKTTINIECWNSGELFEVNEVSPCVFVARLGTQETCETKDVLTLTEKTLEEILEIKRKNNYKR